MGLPLMSFRSSWFLPSIAGSGWTSMVPSRSSTKTYVSACTPAAAGDPELGERRLSPGADQLRRVVHQGHEFLSLFIPMGSIEISSDGLRLAVEDSQRQQNRCEGNHGHWSLLTFAWAPFGRRWSRTAAGPRQNSAPPMKP